MLIRCVKCGKIVDAADPNAAEQTVKCPYCGETFNGADADRFELPAPMPKVEKPVEPAAEKPVEQKPVEPVAEQPKTEQPEVENPVETKPEEQPEQKSDAPAEPVSASRPKIGIRRAAASAANAGGSQLVKEVVSTIEDRVERRDRLVRRRLIVRAVMWFLTVLILVGVGTGAYFCWKKYERAEQGKKQALQEKKPKRVAKKEKKKSPTPEEIAERERKAKAEAARKEAERKEAERKRLEAERARKIAMDFENTKKSFLGTRLAWWGALPKDRQPGAADGVFTLMVKSADGALEYYTIATSNRVATASRVTPSAPPAEVPLKDCLRMAHERGGFFLQDGVCYYAAPGGIKSEWPVPAKGGAAFVPSQEYFGDKIGIVKGLKLDTGSVSFEVKLLVGKEALDQRVGTVGFGAGLVYKDFVKALKILVKDVQDQKRGTSRHIKRKTFRRTVVFYDGTFIATGSNGITKVPRTAPAESGKEYYRWVELRDEANRQEKEAARIEAENKANRPDPIYLVVGPPTDAEVDRLLKSAVVTFERK